MGGANSLLSKETITTLLGQLVLNSQVIAVPAEGAKQKQTGAGIYVLQSCCNHSCVPNCEVAFNTCVELGLKTVEKIREGQELSISYVDNTMPIADRAKRLQNYFFTCECPKCLLEGKMD